MYDIRLLKTDEELYDVGRLRYEVYVREMGRSQEYADNKERTIIEPYDTLSSTRIIVAYLNSELVATSRIKVYYPKDDISELACYRIPQSISDLLTITEGTKYMIKKSLRGTGTTLGMQMMMYAYQVLLEEKVDIDVLNANDYLIHYYQDKGYRRYGDGYHHEELNQFVYPMALLINDYEYFKKTNSPFYEESMTIKYPVDPQKLNVAKTIFD